MSQSTEVTLTIPYSIISLQKSKVDFNINIGKKSSLLGNYDIKGNVFIDDDSVVHGTLKNTGNMFCGKNVNIHGNINSNGNVRVEEKAKIAGNITGNKIFLSKEAIVNGMLSAKNGVSFMSPSEAKVEEKVKRFENDTDIIDEVDNILE